MENNKEELKIHEDVTLAFPESSEEVYADQPIVVKPHPHVSTVEKWIHYKAVEKKVKAELEELKKEAEQFVIDNDDFYQNPVGKVQYIRSSTTKPTDALKELLNQKGYLEMCLKDEVDLKKVTALVEAGVMTQAEVDAHTQIQSKNYLKFVEKK